MKLTYELFFDSLQDDPLIKSSDIKPALLVKIANDFEQTFAKKMREKTKSSTVVVPKKTAIIEAKKCLVLKRKPTTNERLSVAERLQRSVPAQEETLEPVDYYTAGYKRFLSGVRQTHQAFLVQLGELMGGRDSNLYLGRDQLADRIELIELPSNAIVLNRAKKQWKACFI